MNYNMENDIGTILLGADEIREISKRIGGQISEDFKDSEKLVLLCILKGSTPFFCRPHERSNDSLRDRIHACFLVRRYGIHGQA